ncbi:MULTISPECIES: VOC family protein [unclassified Isoptericola]|uniref:VOC family protein n=1 Tax=unclassified Isoptericola TaxID=2623355 RepID=UPI00271334ED|nr:MULTISPECIES: VOC family protein [unclassified Isoptericola]MDO8143065.1 VOC family protein [Isoptericola sp. 178]MDO8146926.1 VOC family protein [Isoptericola sp. b515]
MNTATPRTDDLLAAETTMGAVTLHVGDLAAMSAYYREAIALVELPDLGAPDRVVLGRGRTPVVVLRHTPGLPATSRHQAGLFHTAVLFDTEEALAAAVVHAARHPLSRFVGNADHWVSRAFYFTDPEDNGIELYWDRPRDTWQRSGGRVAMGTDWFDPQAWLQQHLDESALTGASGQGAQVGHVHLQVGDIPTAQRFYVDTLGFEVMADLPGALFVAAGGYHHHLAVNTWNSAGAGPRAASLGLGQVALTVPGQDDVDALRDRLRHARVPVRDDGRTLRFDDPWNTLVEVSVG